MLLRRALARLREAILARPVWVLTVTALTVVLALLLGSRVEFRTSRSELAPATDPGEERLERVVREASSANTVIVCVERTDAELTRQQLYAFADSLAAELERDPLVEDVFYRVPLDWFLERGLYLAPLDKVREAVGEAEARREILHALPGISGLAELNDRIANGIEANLETTTQASAGSGEGAAFLAELVEAEARFLVDPEGYVAKLEKRSSLLTLAETTGALAAEGYIATHDGEKLFLIVAPSRDDDSLPALKSLMGALRRRAAATSAERPGFEVGFTGRPAMTVEEMETVRRDTWFTSSVAVVGVALLTLLVFRWRTHVLLVLGALAAGVIWAFGAVQIELGYLNLITSSFISTLVGVGVAYGIHPVSEYELEGAHARDPRAAVREAYHRTGPPVTVSAVTTAAAFFSILLMRFRGFAELGLVAGVGVLLCLVAALVTLPALLVVYGTRRNRRDRELREGAASAAVDRFWVEQAAGNICRFPRTVSALALLVTAGLAWSARSIGFNTNLLDLLPKNSEALEYQRRMLMESDLSPVSAMILADGYEELRELERRARSEPAIRRFESVLHFLPEDPEGARSVMKRLTALLNELRLPETLPDANRARLASSLERLETASASAADAAFSVGRGDLAGALETARAAAERAREEVLASTADRERVWSDGQRRLLVWARGLLDELKRAASADPPTLDSLPAEIRSRFVTSSGRFVGFLQPADSVFDPRIRADYVAAARRVSPEVVGFPIALHDTSSKITAGFYRSVAVGSVLVLLILLVDYRNLKDAALAVVPLAVGVVWMVGFMGVLGLSFNFANLVAVPLIIGVGIDNGVHVVHRLRFEGREGMGVVLRHTGRAILIASLTTMIGFGSLALASHRGLASLGVLLLLGVGSCLFTSTIVLPNLLVALGQARR